MISRFQLYEIEYVLRELYELAEWLRALILDAKANEWGDAIGDFSLLTSALRHLYGKRAITSETNSKLGNYLSRLEDAIRRRDSAKLVDVGFDMESFVKKQVVTEVSEYCANPRAVRVIRRALNAVKGRRVAGLWEA